YLESFGNPRKFARIARRVSRRKPIIAVKSGRSAAGVRAASSHTAAMASPDIAVDALFRQAGVIRVDTLDELFDMALVLGSPSLPCSVAAPRPRTNRSSAASWPGPTCRPCSVKHLEHEAARQCPPSDRPSRQPGPWPVPRATPPGGGDRPARCPTFTASTPTAP